MRSIIILLFIFLSCSSEKEYRVRISAMDPVAKTSSEKVINIKASSDSSAFKEACSNYWSQKASTMEVNKKFEGTPGYPPLPIPFYFSVETKSGNVITYPKDVAERLTFQIVNYYQTKVIPMIDTIIPLTKKPKEEPAKIY